MPMKCYNEFKGVEIPSQVRRKALRRTKVQNTHSRFHVYIVIWHTKFLADS